MFETGSAGLPEPAGAGGGEGGFETGTKFHFFSFFLLGGDGSAGLLLFLLSGSRGEEEEEEEGGGALCMTIPTSVRRFVLCGIRVGRRRGRGGSLWCGAVVVTGGRRYGAGGWRRRETCDSNAPVTQLLLCSDI